MIFWLTKIKLSVCRATWLTKWHVLNKWRTMLLPTSLKGRCLYAFRIFSDLIRNQSLYQRETLWIRMESNCKISANTIKHTLQTAQQQTFCSKCATLQTKHLISEAVCLNFGSQLTSTQVEHCLLNKVQSVFHGLGVWLYESFSVTSQQRKKKIDKERT